MRTRFTSEKYLKALCNRSIIGQRIKQDAVDSITAAALAVKQVENHINHIHSKHVLTRIEKHQLKLAQEIKDKLIDLAARFDSDITDEMLVNTNQLNKD